MQLKEVYELLCEIYDAAREFIEIYIVNDYDEHTVNTIHIIEQYDNEYEI